MFGIELNPGNIFLGITIYTGMVVAAFWLAMIIWSFRDMRARSRDLLAQIVVALMVALLNLPGLLIYLLLRPRETLSEAYERSLEEEALLQEIEDKPRCPGCGQHVKHEWQACPYCYTRLKNPCVNCHRMLELSWKICPHCTASQPSSADYDMQAEAEAAYAPPTPSSLPEQWTPSADYSRTNGAPAADALEFVDEDDYQQR